MSQNILHNEEELFSQWSVWFQGVDKEKLRKYFEKWKQLNSQCNVMQEVMNKTELLPTTLRKLQRTSDKLNYDIPYRIVVLGESGAGKSSLINALLSQNRLVTGTGAAITGTPIYVHPASENTEEKVVVTYRTDKEFETLVQNIVTTYGITLPVSRDEVMRVYESTISKSSDIEDSIRVQLLTDVNDILTIWHRMEKQELLGSESYFHPDSDKDKLRELMEERSKVNDPKSETRVIPGIKKIDYYVKVQSADALQSNVVLIDTPGVGARTMRHQEILRQEVMEADAVILVVNARRPEDKSASMAHLLEQTLLESFTNEQKNYFAQKVFMVANQMDAIYSTEDKRRLSESVQELCRIVSPTFWAQYVHNNTSNLRYFETIAQLAVLAQLKLQHGSLESQDNIYRGYLEHQLSEEERTAQNTDMLVLTKTQIPKLRTKLNYFLCVQRLRLMLDEAVVHLKQVPDAAEQEIRSFFSLYGLTFDEKMTLDTLSERNVRDLCIKQLETDRDELLYKHKHMIERAQYWRSSSEYRQSLKSTIEAICSELDKQVDDWVKADLDDWVVETRDVVQTGTHTEMHINRYLLTAEQKLRSIVDQEAIRLASYYLDHFQKFIQTNRLYEALEEKSYVQHYITEHMQPAAILKNLQSEITQEFTDICRWVLVYELLRNPILIADDGTGVHMPGVAREVAVYVAELAINLDLTGQSQTLKTMSGLFKKLGKQEAESESKPLAKIPPDQKGQKRAAASKKLLEKLQNALRKQDMTKLKKLIAQELAKRNRIALSESLPYLDMFFFYEIDKFQQAYKVQVKKMCEEHINQVNDRNESIREILVRKNDITLLQARELIGILTGLRQIFN